MEAESGKKSGPKLLGLLSLEADRSLALLAGVTVSCAGVRERSGWTPETRRDLLTGVAAGTADSSAGSGCGCSTCRLNWKFLGANDLGLLFL